ncbi:putative metalloprotease [Kribbella aluminosa]|uniref:Metalloprotease n=1 Tax=Kribbella aluminosa TaxID=416017 RepID=A0ABS4UY88_9ACTN|nr:hypothetical protein [Kribbella aluminosa]MBP2356630.1 putative metalloprotease [Kribbella aluminosa]
MTSEWLDTWGLVVRNTVDDEHDHGNAENHRYWAMAALYAGDPAACNTYTAGLSLVG